MTGADPTTDLTIEHQRVEFDYKIAISSIPCHNWKMDMSNHMELRVKIHKLSTVENEMAISVDKMPHFDII